MCGPAAEPRPAMVLARRSRQGAANRVSAMAHSRGGVFGSLSAGRRQGVLRPKALLRRRRARSRRRWPRRGGGCPSAPRPRNRGPRRRRRPGSGVADDAGRLVPDQPFGTDLNPRHPGGTSGRPSPGGDLLDHRVRRRADQGGRDVDAMGHHARHGRSPGCAHVPGAYRDDPAGVGDDALRPPSRPRRRPAASRAGRRGSFAPIAPAHARESRRGSAGRSRPRDPLTSSSSIRCSVPERRSSHARRRLRPAVVARCLRNARTT